MEVQTAVARPEDQLITSMDTATATQWSRLGEIQASLSVADRVLLALRMLDDVTLGFPVTQLTHCLQTASRAERAGADTEMVVGSLCHDIGKVLPGADHAKLSAELLRPYVRDEVFWAIRAHWAFQLRYTYQYLPGANPEQRRRYRRKSWYPLAARFSDEWDQRSFDPDYDTYPLEHFEPMVREVFDRQRTHGPARRSKKRAVVSRARDILGV